MASLEQLEADIRKIKMRNAKVELDKAWETSVVRAFSVSLITYVTVVLFLYLMGADNYWLTALVPVLGYLLSLQSLPFIRKWWEKNK